MTARIPLRAGKETALYFEDHMIANNANDNKLPSAEGLSFQCVQLAA